MQHAMHRPLYSFAAILLCTIVFSLLLGLYLGCKLQNAAVDRLTSTLFEKSKNHLDDGVLPDRAGGVVDIYCAGTKRSVQFPTILKFVYHWNNFGFDLNMANSTDVSIELVRSFGIKDYFAVLVYRRTPNGYNNALTRLIERQQEFKSERSEAICRYLDKMGA